MSSKSKSTLGAFGHAGVNRKQTIRQYKDTIIGLVKQVISVTERVQELEIELSKAKEFENAQ